MAPGKSGLHVRGEGARVTAGPKRPHLSVCPGPNFPLQGRQGAQGASHVAPGKSGLHVRGEGERVIALEPW